MTTETQKSGGMKKDMVGYLCLLALAAIQFVIAYQSIDASQMFVRMLNVAIVEAALALLFFMHLAENRVLSWFVVVFTVSVLLTLQYGLTDAFRFSAGSPWA